MGLAFLKMDRSRVKWRIKLSQAFDDSIQTATGNSEEDALAKRRARSGKWALFLLPFITLIREGLEAVVFVGGVSQYDLLCDRTTTDHPTHRSRSVNPLHLFPSPSSLVSLPVPSLVTSSIEVVRPLPLAGS